MEIPYILLIFIIVLPVQDEDGIMARKTAFTVPSLEEMEQTDQQVISVYTTAKDERKSSCASSANAPATSTMQRQTAATRSTSTLQYVTKEQNPAQSTTTKPPAVPCVKTSTVGDNTKPLGVRTVPISTGSNQNSRTISGAVASNTASGTSGSVVGAGLSKTGKTNAIVVSARQKGNPVLKYIRNVPWEFGDIVPDYQLGQTSCALFLSTRYHLLYPAYIHERLKQLGRSFDLRVVLMLIDAKDPHHALKEVAKMCILADCSLILAFSVQEAGRYLETYKSFEKKPPDLIMEKTEGNFLSQVTDVFTSARKINKTDAMTLLSTFGTVRGVVESSEEELSLCPGFGPQKAQRLHRLIHEPFIKAKKTKASQQKIEAGVQPLISVASGELKKQDKKETKSA